MAMCVVVSIFSAVMQKDGLLGFLRKVNRGRSIQLLGFDSPRAHIHAYARCMMWQSQRGFIYATAMTSGFLIPFKTEFRQKHHHPFALLRTACVVRVEVNDEAQRYSE